MNPELPGGVTLADVWQARRRIRGQADHTPLRYSPYLVAALSRAGLAQAGEPAAHRRL
ncbi:hypothetical protein GGER_26530 [Serratia rubidaea]